VLTLDLDQITRLFTNWIRPFVGVRFSGLTQEDMQAIDFLEMLNYTWLFQQNSDVNQLETISYLRRNLTQLDDYIVTEDKNNISKLN
jgi:hypothetical protein